MDPQKTETNASQEENNHMVLILASLGLIVLIIPAILFVSLVWTHRPDLSVFDILREAIKEIKNWIAGKN